MIYPQKTDLYGADLLTQVGSSLKRLALDGILARSTGTALQRIYSSCGAIPNFTATNIAQICEARRHLEVLLRAEKRFNVLAEGLRFTAPHTHWADGDIVTIVLDDKENRYLIGRQEVDERAIYLPVSYAFAAEGPICYEWLRLHEGIDPEKFSLLGELASILHGLLAQRDFPFGLSFDYRIERTRDPEPTPTIEVHLTDDLSAVYSTSRFAAHYLLKDDDEFEAVAWIAVLNPARQSLELHEAQLLNEIERYISGARGGFGRRKRLEHVLNALS